jgi:hypothetical protein
MVRVHDWRCSASITRGEQRLDLKLTFSGYYDQGRTYGRPEDCYPPEGEINFHTVKVGDGEPQGFDNWGLVFGLTEEEIAKLEEAAFEAMLNHQEDDRS